jgi:hypothetical protein
MFLAIVVHIENGTNTLTRVTSSPLVYVRCTLLQWVGDLFTLTQALLTGALLARALLNASAGEHCEGPR